ncbi:MAG: hypothetical protein II567_04840 [Candidatus Riflebacteria bacterium]|nr:hypothetical protein [Candidatus Riflebacteria bacterium]
MVHKNRKNGFTVVEICIACIVFVLLMGGAYGVFTGVSKSFQRSTKSLGMQNEMRNGLNFIREEMQRASYRSEIKINGNKIDENYKFRLCKASEVDGKANKQLAEWFICKPFKQDGTGVVFTCSLVISDNKILYTKMATEKSDASEAEFENKVVLNQIGKIKFSTEEFTAGSSNKGALINIEAFAVDSTSGQADLKISAQTGARVEVEVLRDI